ncbi:MAG TPA: hypothetical protein VF816_17235 [Rhodocyclaceae bacterium]
MRLDNYVGRMVRLNQESFVPIAQRARRQGMDLENQFIVANISPEQRKLICYGADVRVAVSVRDVALV